MRLKNKVALVTGAASGIGLATVRRFVDEGAHVVALDLDLERTLAALGGLANVTPAAADVSKSAEVNKVFEMAEGKHGRLDVLVNAAGISAGPADIEDITDEDFARVVEVNLYGSFYTLRAAAKLMRRNGDSGGSIVNISSVGALANFPLPAAYPASKAAVLGMTRATAALLAPDNIRVNAVAPGATDTPMLPADPEFRNAVVNLGVMKRAASAEELANTILFLASDEAAFFTGQTLSPNGGYVM
ncbi:SDR family NAD(P)-dependent oxidoreductase [Arthrobacter sp. KN11-1C]|uniref:SDR family NAD(P)-dependent oxidoreductase n=1 Tax=Arthrobacter sp. KN11-1C TaxID=3445774 RepID=UPI003FA100F9